LDRVSTESVRDITLAVRDIASALSFTDASSFTRAFRHASDIAPTGLHDYASLRQRGMQHAGRERFT
jgi:AraC-like DNA-binding protein